MTEALFVLLAVSLLGNAVLLAALITAIEDRAAAIRRERAATSNRRFFERTASGLVRELEALRAKHRRCPRATTT